MIVERMVVGVDGSQNSVVAVRWAAGLARQLGAEVVAVHALGLLESLDSGEPVPSFPNREKVRELFETTWCAPLHGGDIRTRHELRDGAAISVLLAVADEVAADLIVLGSRGLGGYPELLLGSTSTQVAQNAHRPVVIVPALIGSADRQ